jgi:hypothetical protein
METPMIHINHGNNTSIPFSKQEKSQSECY